MSGEAIKSAVKGEKQTNKNKHKKKIIETIHKK